MNQAERICVLEAENKRLSNAMLRAEKRLTELSFLVGLGARELALESANEILVLALRRADRLIEDINAMGNIESHIIDIKALSAQETRAISRHEALPEQLPTVKPAAGRREVSS